MASPLWQPYVAPITRFVDQIRGSGSKSGSGSSVIGMNDGGLPGHYEPFPGFLGWCDDFDSAVVDSYADLLDHARASATDEAMRAAVEVATRYAAVDTGAIEGL